MPRYHFDLTDGTEVLQHAQGSRASRHSSRAAASQLAGKRQR
ncbi:MAG: hypothetical protein ACJ8DX_19190 [Xanthobacteraceae bacterium]